MNHHPYKFSLIILSLAFIIPFLLTGCGVQDDIFHLSDEHYIVAMMVTNVSSQTPSLLEYNSSDFEVDNVKFDIAGEFPYLYDYCDYIMMPMQIAGDCYSNPAYPGVTRRYYLYDGLNNSRYVPTENQDESLRYEMYMSSNYDNYFESDAYTFRILTTGGPIVPAAGNSRNFSVLSGSFKLPSFFVNGTMLTQLESYLIRGREGNSLYEMFGSIAVYDYIIGGTYTTNLTQPHVYVYYNGSLINDTEYDQSPWPQVLDPINISDFGQYSITVDMPTYMPIFELSNVSYDIVQYGSEIVIPEYLELDAPMYFEYLKNYSLGIRMNQTHNVSIYLKTVDDENWTLLQANNNSGWYRASKNITTDSESLQLKIFAQGVNANVTYQILPVSLKAVRNSLSMIYSNTTTPGSSLTIYGYCTSGIGDYCGTQALGTIIDNGSLTRTLLEYYNGYYFTWLIPPNMTRNISVNLSISTLGRYLSNYTSRIIPLNVYTNDILVKDLTVQQAALHDNQNVSVEVWNAGLASQSNISVRLSVDGILNMTYNITSLAPGSYVKENFTLRFDNAKSYLIFVNASLSNDQKKTNNIALRYIDVGSDLSVSISNPYYGLSVDIPYNFSTSIGLKDGSFENPINFSLYMASTYYDWTMSLNNTHYFYDYYLIPYYNTADSVRVEAYDAATDDLIFNNSVPIGTFVNISNNISIMMPYLYSYSYVRFMIGNFVHLLNESVTLDQYKVIKYSYTPNQSGVYAICGVVRTAEDYYMNNNFDIEEFYVTQQGPDISTYIYPMGIIAVNYSSEFQVYLENAGSNSSGNISVNLYTLRNESEYYIYRESMEEINFSNYLFNVTYVTYESPYGNDNYIYNITVDGPNLNIATPAYEGQRINLTDNISIYITYGYSGAIQLVVGWSELVVHTTTGNLLPSRSRYLYLYWTPNESGYARFLIEALTNNEVYYFNNYDAYYSYYYIRPYGPDLEIQSTLSDYILEKGVNSTFYVGVRNDGPINVTNYTIQMYDAYDLDTVEPDEWDPVQNFTFNGQNYMIAINNFSSDYANFTLTYNGNEQTFRMSENSYIFIGRMLLYLGWASTYSAQFYFGNYNPLQNVTYNDTIDSGNYDIKTFDYHPTIVGVHGFVSTVNATLGDILPNNNNYIYIFGVLMPGLDLDLSFNMTWNNNRVALNNPTTMTYNIRNIGMDIAEDYNLSIYADGAVIYTMSDDYLYLLYNHSGSYSSWTPTSYGTHNITAVTDSTSTDTNRSNNVKSVIFSIANPSSNGNSNSGGGGGGGGGGPTYSISTPTSSINTNLKAIYTIVGNVIKFPKISPNTPYDVKMKILEIERLQFVSVSDFTNSTMTIYNSTPRGVEGLNIYSGFTILPESLTAESLRDVKISFKVPKQWLSDNNLSVNDVFLFSFIDEHYKKLSTSVTAETNTDVLYTSDTPGLGPYLVASGIILEDNLVTGAASANITDTDTKTSTVTMQPLTVYILVGILVVFGLAIFIARRIMSNKETQKTESPYLNSQGMQAAETRDKIIQINDVKNRSAPGQNVFSRANVKSKGYPQVASYIAAEKSIGASEMEIRESLTRAGWSQEIINQELLNAVPMTTDPYPQVSSYILNQRAAGISDAQIRQILIRAGWTNEIINDEFLKVKK